MRGTLRGRLPHRRAATAPRCVASVDGAQVFEGVSVGGDIVAWVQDRLQRDTTLTPPAKALVSEALAPQVDTSRGAGQSGTHAMQPTARSTSPTPLFISQITVGGFRGIAAEVQLGLAPQPGLTLISGRNGSGKSSLAEALELVIAGDVRRLAKRTAAWKANWRNVHADVVSARVCMDREGHNSNPPHVELAAQWTADAQLAEVRRSLQIGGKPAEETDPWDADAKAHRPLLMYDDISDLLQSGATALYDAISQVLGLEALSDAVQALAERSKEANTPAKWLTAEKKDLLGALAELADERAQRAMEQLGKRDVDVAALRRLATGTTTPGKTAQYLMDVEELRSPTEAECSVAANALRSSAAAYNRIAAVSDQTLELRGAVLTAALDLHAHVGNQPCPVCGVGTLGITQAAAMRTAQGEIDKELSQQSDAQIRLRQALAAARALIQALPAVFATEPPPALRVRARVCAETWRTWAQPPDDPLELADHLDAQGGALRRALADLQEVAANQQTTRDDAWIPLATRLAAYATEYESWQTNKQAAKDADTAHKWLRDAETELKNERLSPVLEDAARVWSALREGSSVEVAHMALKGAATARQLRIDARVDGESVGALGVMSQGELHALALALFLALATATNSPFGFVVLDDPVQAMDTAKVAAFAHVLARIAATRQVLVFTHDERFVSAVRHLDSGAAVRILQVERGPRSTMQVTGMGR